MNKRLGTHPSFKGFIAGCLVASLITCGLQPVTAAVDDNLGSLGIKIADALGVGKENNIPEEADFKEASLTEKLNYLQNDLGDLKTKINKVSVQVSNQSATQGGGCYYTVYSKKNYLDGYKLRLSDGTSAKSCVIQYDEDSDYFAGFLKAPLNDNISVEIIDATSGISQGKLDTSAITTRGYATINLDDLIQRDLASLLYKDDTLASCLYKDSSLTKDTACVSRYIDALVQGSRHLDDFMSSTCNIDINSTSMQELYNNQNDFLTVMRSEYATYFIEHTCVGQDIANSRQLLRWIIDDSSVVALCEGNAVFCGYLQNTTLPTITQTKTAGEENVVEGNLLCLSITSGCRGNDWSGSISTLRCSHDYINNYIILRNKAISINGDILRNLNNNSDTLLLANESGGYYMSCSSLVHNYNNVTYDTNNKVIRNKFANKLVISAYPDKAVDLGIYTFYNGNGYGGDGDYAVGSLTSGSKNVDSSIVYINLDDPE